MMPPGCVFERGLVCRFTSWIFSTITRFLSGMTMITLPVLPLWLPEMTLTVSFFTMLRMTVCLRSQHFGCERYDLHELLVAELACHRSENTRSDGLLGVVDDDGGVLVETNERSVLATRLLAGADDHGLRDLALFHQTAG